MIKPKSVLLNLLLSSAISARSSGRRFIDLIVAVAPGYAPEKFNHYEPVNKPFLGTALDEVLDSWGTSFLWRRTKPGVEGSVWMGAPNRHDVIQLRLAPAAADVDALIALCGEIDRAFGIDFGYVHVATDVDSGDRETYVKYTMPLAQGLSTHDLRQGIPDFPWAVMFGPPYIRMFGEQQLEASPAAHVKRMSHAIWIQLTNTPLDVAYTREVYISRRDTIKRYLDHHAFRGASESDGCQYPPFHF